MTRIERQMEQWGYYLSSIMDTRAEAEEEAAMLQRCGQGQAICIRRCRNGWALWIETSEAHNERSLACD